jgi:hypothetical protein
MEEGVTFLTGERARAWAGVLAIVSALVLVVMLVTSRGGMDPLGRPVGTDFASFWTASRLALRQGGASAYDIGAHAAEQAAAFPQPAGAPELYYAFFYPPPFLLVCLWTGLLPYLLALVAWLAAGFVLLLVAIRRMLPGTWPWRWGALALGGFPGVLQNVLSGQNGFLSAACFGWAAVLAARRPFWAGACLGLLVCKPHLLVAAPVVLLAGRRWTMIAGGVCSAFGFSVASWLVLGPGAWAGFLAGARLARATLEQGLVAPAKLDSAFAAVRLLGGGVGAAYAAQAVVAAAVAAALAVVVARRPGARTEMVLLTAGAMLCSPFLLDYDLTCLAVPLAWLLTRGQTGCGLCVAAAGAAACDLCVAAGCAGCGGAAVLAGAAAVKRFRVTIMLHRVSDARRAADGGCGAVSHACYRELVSFQSSGALHAERFAAWLLERDRGLSPADPGLARRDRAASEAGVGDGGWPGCPVQADVHRTQPWRSGAALAAYG